MCEEEPMIHQQSGKWKWAVLTWEGEDFSHGRGPRPFPTPEVFGYEILHLTHPAAFPPGHLNTAPDTVPALISFLHLKTLPVPALPLKKGWTPCVVTGHCFQGGHVGPWASLINAMHKLLLNANCEHLPVSVAAYKLRHDLCISYNSVFPQAEISFLETSPGPREPCLHSNGVETRVQILNIS